MMHELDCCINSFWFVALLKLLLYIYMPCIPCTKTDTIVSEFNSFDDISIDEEFLDHDTTNCHENLTCHMGYGRQRYKAVHDSWLCTSALSPAQQQFMATISKLSAFVFLFVLLANSLVLSSGTEPKISASPTVLPYLNAPDIASFFPTPSADRPMNSAAPPEAEAYAPAPSSGEFIGKKSSSSSRLNCAAAIVATLLCSFLMTSTVV
ncbi:hypothetical protein VNO77_34342 [Canavalia gladiata]|uniref:Uncharacterized protein n=1 Tax=Canavalia gladiata TaxID=3824 RepID=A0AAN9PZQ1_CANGL